MAIITVIKEGSSSFLTITFYDKDGSEFVPTSATYEVGDENSETILQTETSLPVGSSIEIEITPEINRILDDYHQVETRVVTIRGSSGAEKFNEEYKYKVKNLRFVT